MSVSISRKAFGDAYIPIETYNTNSMLFFIEMFAIYLGVQDGTKGKKGYGY